MHPIFQKTLGGLSKEYYTRQFLFGLIFPALILFVKMQADMPGFSLILMMLINTALYPYSRFVYESIVGFIMGNNVFIANAVMLLVAKLFTMALCWGAAIFIAPVGLAYLYYHHSKNEAQD